MEGKAIQFCRRLIASGRCFSIAVRKPARSPPSFASAPFSHPASIRRGIARATPAAAATCNSPRRLGRSTFDVLIHDSLHSIGWRM
jgi:hypothetical protein